MNMKFVKRILAVSMAATIMVVPMVAGASGTSEQSSSESTASTAADTQIATVAENTAKSTTAVVNGKTLKTNVAGNVDVTSSKTVKAFVLNSSGGKTAGDKQTVFAKTKKDSPAAFASAEGAAAAIGGTIVGDALNADITLKNGGTAQVVLNEIPAGTVKIVQIGKGGATTVLDATVEGTVVSFVPTNGHYTYFVVVI